MSQPEPQVKKEVVVKKEKSNTSSPTKQQEWQTIPLKSCTQEEINDVRFHIMKFATKQDVDIVKDFTKPVRLHRKDPRNMQFHLTREELDQRKREQEQAKLEKIKQEEEEGKSEEALQQEERRKKKEEIASKIAPEKPTNKNGTDLSQVAPDGGARKNRKNLFKRKTRQINLMDEGKRKLRYEEHYPWVIEDYDGKNVYVGNYEAGSTEQQHVLFVFDKDGFKMIPAEKVYRFTPRNRYATLTLEEAEAKMERNSSVPRWLMKHMEDRSISEGAPDQRFRYNSPAMNGSLIANAGGSGSGGRGRMRTVLGGSGSGNDRDSDHDDLDFEEEFADDEEAPIMDGDEEENKLSERKIKKEMLKAAHFDGQSDAEVDDDLNDLFETEKSRKVDKEGKKLRKVLNKREGGVYDSDDEDVLLPYLSKSDLESDEESEEEIQVKKEPGLEDSPTTTGSKRPREVSVKNINDGFVIIKAPQSFLTTMPPGEWNPQVRKRQTPEANASPRKKIKLDDKVKKEKSTSPTPGVPSGSGSGAAPASNGSGAVDLNNAGPDNLLVTVKDVLDIVRDHPLTTKELLVGLKSRVSAHPDNKQRIISIVKQNLRLEAGKLVLKE
ncbi:TFG1 Transcription initiation factor IIF subunit alpha [Candida maltosa Xu316]